MIFIPFSSLNEALQDAATDFVKKHESFSVQFSAAVIKSKENLFVVFDKSDNRNDENDGNSFCKSDNEEDEISSENIFGVLVFGKSVLHCLPFFRERKQNSNSEIQIPEAEKHISDATEQSADSEKQSAKTKTEPSDSETRFLDSENRFENAFSYALKNFYTEKNITLPFSVNGEKNGTSAVLAAFSLLGKKPAQTNEYNLLRLNVKEFLKRKPFPLSQGETYVICGKNLPPALFESLSELQKNYEIEEVTPSCFSFNEDLSRLKLKNSLRRQCILAVADKNGKLVSKVQTNAVANRFAQIGGVYTNQNNRRKHYAFNLMILLCRKILKAKKNPVLFVKTENRSAAFLYEKLGFKKTDSYTIAYFSHNE